MVDVVRLYVEGAGRNADRFLMEVCKAPIYAGHGGGGDAVMLWCEVRPAEVQRLTWEDI